MNNKRDEFINCPFCSSDKISVRTKTMKRGSVRVYYASARCGKCNARGPVISDTSKESLEQLKVRARRAWNYREI